MKRRTYENHLMQTRCSRAASLYVAILKFTHGRIFAIPTLEYKARLLEFRLQAVSHETFAG
jgi:hypothetical protein